MLTGRVICRLDPSVYTVVTKYIQGDDEHEKPIGYYFL